MKKSGLSFTFCFISLKMQFLNSILETLAFKKPDALSVNCFKITEESNKADVSLFITFCFSLLSKVML